MRRTAWSPSPVCAVYGVPETFIVGREGTIVYKMVGPVTAENIDTVLKVEIEKALKAGS
jgi:cytochrome c biogenesis protein CcmG/thiol:disulfide interchange protein DsbE